MTISRSRSLVVAITLGSLLLGATGEVRADEPICALHQRMSIERQLRKLSLALRGHVPAVGEYDLVEGATSIDDSIYEAYIASDAFRLQARRFHEQLLWTNPAGSRLTDVGIELRFENLAGGGQAWDFGNPGKRSELRGGDSSHRCQDVPQQQLQPGYQLGDMPTCEFKGYDVINNPPGPRPYCREGTVLIRPFWLPAGTPPQKVCAFAAQSTYTWSFPGEDTNQNDILDVEYPEDANDNGILDAGEDINENGVLDGAQDLDGDNIIELGEDLNANRNLDADAGEELWCNYISAGGPASRKGCGCGPALNFCNYAPLQSQLWTHMREQLLLMVDDHTRGEQPYSEMLTTTDSYMNGPLAHYTKYQAQQAGLSASTYNVYQDSDPPLWPNPDWNDTAFVAVERQAPHSGILTLPAYSLRFQTNRGRANRVRIAFMDQYFVPPEVYNQQGCDPDSSDTAERCVCEHCHRVLEPLAAYFGQVAERGSGLLTSLEKEFYGATKLSDCNNQLGVGPIALCNRFYATDYSELELPYRIVPLLWAKDHPEHEVNYDAGPAGLAQLATAPIEGKSYSLFARATVKNLFAFLMHREMNLDPAADDNEIELMQQLASELTSTDDFAALTLEIVKLDSFARTP